MIDIFPNGNADSLYFECTGKGNAAGVDTVSYKVKYERMSPDICEGCGRKIKDRYVMKVGEARWHEQCLSCNSCGILLDHSCYCRNNKFYCKSDYIRLFGIKCSRCGERILPEDLVMKAKTFVYHVSCFTCLICCQTLQKGEQFILRNGQLFCRPDFEKELFLLQQTASPDNMLTDENCRPRDGRRGPKRPRTILTSIQRRQFKASFEISPKPCRKVREALAKDTGLSVRVVQVWFQNQRAKMKKIQRKAKQEPDKGGDKNIKADIDGSQESDHYLNLSMHNDSNDTTYNSSSHPLNPNNPYSPDDGTYIADEQSVESFCSSSSLDGSINLDEGVGSEAAISINLSIQNKNNESSSRNGHVLEGSINPIDKLYLMQNSYFNTGDH